MNIREIIEYIKYSRIDEDDETSKPSSWLTADDSPAFLRDSVLENVPIYLSVSGLFMYSAFFPQKAIDKNVMEDMLNWNFGPSGGYGYGESYEKGHTRPTPRIFPPLDKFGTRSLNNAEPVFFLRQFEGYSPSAYLEISQKFSQIAGVHWVQSKYAYCRLNLTGDPEEVVYAKYDDDGIFCVSQQHILEFYMLLTKTVLVRFFEVMRYDDVMNLISGNRRSIDVLDPERELYFRKLTSSSEGILKGTVLRGYQVLRNRRSYKELSGLITGREAKQYALFIAHDWKHNIVREYSCDPAQLGNYFVESDLPYETSPAFFKPEVLSKYKQDPDKYSVKQRSISCRSAWSLKTYDINEAGQVHTYLIYLGHLPYQEQLYWKSFNEPPKASISKRAITTDFMGEWDTSYNPLESLEALLLKFPTVRYKEKLLPIWALPSQKSREPFPTLHYVITDSVKEWQDQILELAKVIIDNFQKRNIRSIASSLQCDNPQLGSLKLLNGCLNARGLDKDIINEVMKPLYELWETRSSISAHSGGQVPATDLKLDHRNRLTEIHGSLKLLSELILSGVLNIE
jgi:hypothetical protein